MLWLNFLIPLGDRLISTAAPSTSAGLVIITYRTFRYRVAIPNLEPSNNFGAQSSFRQTNLMDGIREKIWAQLFIVYTRYLIGGAFVFASIVKITGNRFTAESGAENPIDSAWHFFETLYASGLYWKFIGVAQLFAGFLLLTQRYARLGALVNLPIIFNIFIITLSYYFAYTPVITGLMLLANILLIVWEWDALRILVGQDTKMLEKGSLEKDRIWSILGLTLFVQIVCFKFFLDKDTAPFWLLSFPTAALAGFIIGLKREFKRKRLRMINRSDV